MRKADANIDAERVAQTASEVVGSAVSVAHARRAIDFFDEPSPISADHVQNIRLFTFGRLEGEPAY